MAYAVPDRIRDLRIVKTYIGNVADVATDRADRQKQVDQMMTYISGRISSENLSKITGLTERTLLIC